MMGGMRIRGAVLSEIGLGRPYAGTRPLAVEELELAGPGPSELLVQMEAAGLCHSDLSVVDGNRVRPVPMLLGHEAAGRVLQVGESVSGVSPGQRVVMAFLPRCGRCSGCAADGRLPCVPGSAANNAGELLGGGRRLTRPGGAEVHHHLGVSGFATHAVVDAASAVPVEDDVPPEIAAVLGCAVLTGGGAVRNAGRPGPGQSVMIVGLGGVGMAALLVALAERDVEVIAVDVREDKLRLALEWGAHRVATVEQVREGGVHADVVVEAAGHPAAFEAAVEATAPGGTTVTVGLPSPQARAAVSPLGLVAQARTIIGSYLGSAVPARDIPAYAQAWRDGRLPVERLVSGTLRLDQINEGMDDLADGAAIRQVVVF